MCAQEKEVTPCHHPLTVILRDCALRRKWRDKIQVTVVRQETVQTSHGTCVVASEVGVDPIWASAATAGEARTDATEAMKGPTAVVAAPAGVGNGRNGRSNLLCQQKSRLRIVAFTWVTSGALKCVHVEATLYFTSLSLTVDGLAIRSSLFLA